MEVGDKVYRYEARRYSIIIDADTDLYGTSRAELERLEYKVTHLTPKGFWISHWFEGAKDRWVSNTSLKRFAHPTVDEAKEAYRQRKRSYVQHCRNRLRRAEEDLRLVTGVEGLDE